MKFTDQDYAKGLKKNLSMLELFSYDNTLYRCELQRLTNSRDFMDTTKHHIATLAPNTILTIDQIEALIIANDKSTGADWSFSLLGLLSKNTLLKKRNEKKGTPTSSSTTRPEVTHAQSTKARRSTVLCKSMTTQVLGEIRKEETAAAGSEASSSSTPSASKVLLWKSQHE
jgi:hypothetical protein